MRAKEAPKARQTEVARQTRVQAKKAVAVGAKGFALEMRTGEDETDAEFRRA